MSAGSDRRASCNATIRPARGHRTGVRITDAAIFFKTGLCNRRRGGEVFAGDITAYDAGRERRRPEKAHGKKNYGNQQLDQCEPVSIADKPRVSKFKSKGWHQEILALPVIRRVTVLVPAEFVNVIVGATSVVPRELNVIVPAEEVTATPGYSV